MKRTTILTLTTLFVVTLSVGYILAKRDGADTPLQYPEARRVEHVDTYHGVKVEDPYRWMEEMASEEVKTWVKAQDMLLESYVEDVKSRDAVKARIQEITNNDSYRPPVRKGNRFFYSMRPAGKYQGIIFVQEGLDGKPRQVLNPFEKLDTDHRLVVYSPSHNGKLMAFSHGPGQTRWHTIRVQNVDSGEWLDDELTGFNISASSLAWDRENRGFFYVHFTPPAAGQAQQSSLENPRVMYHKLGKAQSEDREVFVMPTKGKWLPAVRTTPAANFLIVSLVEGAGSFTGLSDRIHFLNLRQSESEFAQLLPSIKAKMTFEGNHGDMFLLRTTLDAPRQRVVSVDVADNPDRIVREVIPESDDVITSVSTLGEKMVIRYSQDAKPIAKVFTVHGDFKYMLQLPDIGNIGGIVDAKEGDIAFYMFAGLYDPGTVYSLDLDSGKSTLFKRPEMTFEPERFTTQQVFYESKDGTRIPMFVAHQKGLKLDGSNPTFLYAYGAFGWAAFPYYQAHIIAWMENGGVYALPNIRGGGEYGEEWIAAGTLRNKPTAIDDYIAAAEWLADSDFTSHERLIANGGSASGVLAGAAIVKQPHLFGAAIIDIPALDMLRFTEFTGGPYWTSEYGDPAKPEDFEVLHSYSPYHNLKPETCYPPTLIMAGELDESTVPMHAYKFVARMQHLQSCDNPVLLNMMWGAGHNYGPTPEESAKNWADAWAFAFKTLDIK